MFLICFFVMSDMSNCCASFVSQQRQNLPCMRKQQSKPTEGKTSEIPVSLMNENDTTHDRERNRRRFEKKSF